jgi:hypothetical protein
MLRKKRRWGRPLNGQFTCRRLVVTEEMPRSVWCFEKLAWGSLLLGGLVTSLDWKRIVAKGVYQGRYAGIPEVWLKTEFEVMSRVAFLTAVATFFVILLLVWLAARRRINWVRWLLAALFVLGGPTVFANLKEVLSVNPTVAVLESLHIILQVAALALVFLPSARPWFWKEAVDMASA